MAFNANCFHAFFYVSCFFRVLLLILSNADWYFPISWKQLFATDGNDYFDNYETSAKQLLNENKTNELKKVYDLNFSHNAWQFNSFIIEQYVLVCSPPLYFKLPHFFKEMSSF